MKAMELRFMGSVPESYDRMMVPLIFQPYADELARRARQWALVDILETAAGTGVVTEALHKSLPNARITATDLNQPMIDVARERDLPDTIRFEQANAQQLPFPDNSFDLVVCQFGAMFFPDKVQAYSEARRVLRPRGRYLLAIWDEIDRNPLSAAAQRALIEIFPQSPPLFLREGPFGYHDAAAIEADLRAAGFATIEVETIERKSEAPSAHEAAKAFCYGSPMGAEVDDIEPGALDRVFVAIEKAFGAFESASGIDAPMSAHILTAIK